MAEKTVVSTRSKMSGTSYPLPSVHDCGNEFLELVRENSEILVRAPSNIARNGSSRICYTFNTSNGEADHYTSDTYVRTSTQIESTVHSFLDFKRREDSNQHFLKLDPQHVGKEANLTNEKATQLGDRSENQIYTSTQQGEASSSHTLLNGGLEMKNQTHFQDAEANRNTGVSFSVFSRIAGVVKCTDRCSRVAGPSSNSVVSRFEEITVDNDYEKQSPAEGNRKLAAQSAEGSNSCTLSQFQRETIVSKAKEKEKVVGKTCKESIADGHFEALYHNKNMLRMDTLHHQLLASQSSDKKFDHQEKENPHAKADKTVYMVASSVGSLEASNAQTHSKYRNKHYHQPGGKRKYLQARDDAEVKRTRHSKTHNFSDKKRRDRIRKKMRTLQQLVPSCKKMDKISVLDKTIEYLKTLQLQLQIMSMGRGLYMRPVNTMIPTTTGVAPQSTQSFNRMTSGMDPTNDSSMFCSLTHFPCLQMGPTTTSGTPGNMFHMFGFPWQMPVPLSIPQVSHIPGVGNPEKQSDPVPHVSGATNQLGEHDSSPSETIFRNFIPSDVNALHH